MIKNLSLSELCKLCGGADFWHSYGVPLHNIPAMTMSDGPHGLRKQDDQADHLGIHDSIRAICFPSASSLAASFDRNAAYKMGQLLGEEARAEGVHILLGPAINIKRTPLCGRNFEYFSEDPYLTGELAAQVLKGIQSKGVGACVKHFAANNQENGRMVLSANVQERTLREIYLRAFERVMQESPRAVMSAYNRVNGEYASESKRLLTDILRDEWGFQGIVISDWYAVDNRVSALLAGMDLEMPGGPMVATKQLEAAATDPNVYEAICKSAQRIAKTAKALCLQKTDGYDKDAHHDAAVNLAAESAVLLKNDNHFLPLSATQKVLIIGKYAKQPRFQGGGSSHINAYQTESALDYIPNADYFEDEGNLPLLRKYLLDNHNQYSKIVVFAGLSDECESEGYDRQDLDLPAETNAAIQCAVDSGAKVGVVLFNGSPVAMPWLERVQSVLLAGLSGEGAGKACAALLYGKVNPSGRLAESYPLCIEHTPAYLNSRNNKNVCYAEGVFVGYRYYSTKKLPTLFPFGHGLSYTQFEYSSPTITIRDDSFLVSVHVTNVGTVSGKETVQLYVAPPANGTVDRPCIELRGFEKLSLDAHETKEVCFTLSLNDFRYFDEVSGSWRTEGGTHRIVFGRSAETEICAVCVDILLEPVPPTIDDNVTVGELLRYPPTASLLSQMVKGYSRKPEGEAIGSEMKQAMLDNAPLRLVKGLAKLDAPAYQQLKDTLTALTQQANK